MGARVVLWAAALLVVPARGFSFLDDQEALLAVELAESDYADMCADRANATWEWLLHPTQRNLRLKLQADEDLAQAQRSNSDSLREFSDPASLEDAGLRERVILASTPGAATLSLAEYRKVIRFAARSRNITQTRTIPCYRAAETANARCSWDWTQSQKVLSGSHDPYQAHQVWIEWHKLFTGQANDFRYLQELLVKSADHNGATNVYQYWQLLTDFTESGRNASSLWDENVQELYSHLKNFVLSRLRYQYGQDMVGDDDLLPVHLLGSFVGDDWLKIADLVTPPFHEVYKNISSALKKKRWGGQHLYEVAAGVGSKMGLPSLKKTPFWENIHFNGSCPAVVVPWCSKNFISVQTCEDFGLHAYLDAHRVMMHALMHHLSVHDGRYILRQLNRHSALLEGLMGLGEMIAMSQQQLVRLGLLNGDKNTDEQLRLLLALRTLPRLAHALAADNWRAEGSNSTWNSVSGMIKGVRPPRDVVESWEFVQDNTIALNQPYLGTFAGIILQFQLFEKLVQNNENSTQNPVDVIKKDGTLRKLMAAGLSEPWLDVLNQVLGISIVDTGPLLRYFAPIKNILMSSIPSDTPRIPQFEHLKLPPDVAKEITSETTVAIDRYADSAAPTVSSRSQEMGPTRKSDQPSENSTLPPDLESGPKEESNDKSQIILVGSLSLIGIGLAAGVILLSRHFYHKKRQRERRNRRPT